MVFDSSRFCTVSFGRISHIRISSFTWYLPWKIFIRKIILSLTREYFKGQESVGERSTIIVTAFAYLVLVMMVLIIDEATLETGLDAAYSKFSSGAASFLKTQGFRTQWVESFSSSLNCCKILTYEFIFRGPASKLILKFTLAVWSSIIGATLVFPGLRLARMHWDSLK